MPSARKETLVAFLAGAVLSLLLSNLLHPRDGGSAVKEKHQQQQAEQQQEGQEWGQRARVTILGDSISQFGFETARDGWTATLADWWQRRADVVSRGLSGYNSRWAAFLLPQVMRRTRPDLLMIFYGANDDAASEGPQHGMFCYEDPEHVPLAEYEQNLERMVLEAQRISAKPLSVVLITPPPVDEDKYRITAESKGYALNRFNDVARQYAEACKHVAQRLDTGLVDAWAAMEGASDRRGEYLWDGLHLSGAGNQKLAEAVQREIERKFPNFLPQRLPADYPMWADIDARNPSNTLGGIH